MHGRFPDVFVLWLNQNVMRLIIEIENKKGHIRGVGQIMIVIELLIQEQGVFEAQSELCLHCLSQHNCVSLIQQGELYIIVYFIVI